MIRLLFLALILRSVRASLYDPHPYPAVGPFVEGWYMRLIDHKRDNSIGLLFGKVLPDPKTETVGPLVVASILVRRGDGSRRQKLVSYNGFFPAEACKITVNGGQTVTHNPDLTSSPSFSWSVGQDGGFSVNGNTILFRFNISGVVFRGELKGDHSWDSTGTGPEGWLYYLPLPLHWFVYSLGSNVVFYQLSVGDGSFIQSDTGIAHLEKNWGVSFPESWVWSEGVQNGSDVSYALSGGLVPFGPVSVNAYLIGYRNPDKGLNLNFRPTNSIVTLSNNACAGEMNITVHGLFNLLELSVKAPDRSFSECLYGPESTGFTRDCVESYDAVARVVVKQRRWFSANDILDSQIIKRATLEFGGKHMCSPCSDMGQYSTTEHSLKNEL